MTNFGNNLKSFGQKLFGKSEVQNRISKSALKVIFGDVCTLYAEFKKAKGYGALFFNPFNPEKSTYLTLPEIRNDIALAEELCDEETAKFLKILSKVVDKEADSENSIVVLVDNKKLALFTMDLNEINKHIDEIADAYSRL
jgi:hypothetical protein